MLIKAHFKSAISLVGVTFLLGVGINLLTPSRVSAQSNETFSECVTNLDDLPNVRVGDAIEDCQSVYSRQWVGEPFSECVANLDELPNVRVDDAIGACQTVFVGDYVGETFSECIRKLDSLPNVRVDDARDVCAVVVENAEGLSFPASSRTESQRNLPPSGDPQAISDCIQRLLYERRPVCTRSGCAQLSSPAENADRNFGGWQWQTVRTDVRESTAAEACQNARY